MRKIFITLFIGMMSIMMVGCATTKATRMINNVELGMTKEDIRHMLGKPSYRNAWQDGEQWGYHKHVGEIAGPEPVLFVVAFNNDGRVVEFETKRDFPAIPVVR